MGNNNENSSIFLNFMLKYKFFQLKLIKKKKIVKKKDYLN